ncbi:MAG: diguanylate cyclase [Mycobacteriaceae bacterium]
MGWTHTRATPSLRLLLLLLLGIIHRRATGSSAVVLAVLAIGYAECAARVVRLKCYLGSGKVLSNQSSVWTFAAVLCVPASWAAVLAIVVYLHVLVQRRRDNSGQPYRVVFTASTVILSVLAGGTVLAAVGGGMLTGGLVPTTAVVVAMVVCNSVNCGLVPIGVWLTLRPPSVRSILPDAPALGYELASFVLGIVVAGFLLFIPLLTPVALALVIALRRSSLVNDLHHAARTDSKTGLLTAAAWTDNATGAVSRSSRDGHPVTILFCDLDAFKAVNDTHGHLIGDQVLVAVADCLRRELRSHDGLGRYGGEEFVVILDRLDLSEAQQVAERLRAAIRTLHLARDVQITMSIGLAHHELHHGPPDLHELLARADTALYQAKDAGRNCVHSA